MNDQPPQAKFVYTDDPHMYHVGGRKAPGASTAAKIVADTYLIEKWADRQIAIGMALDRNIVENVAAHIDNDDRINGFVEDAKKAAGAHRKADRGTQAHRVLYLSLLGREDQLLTAQQHKDLKALKRTFDRYGLEPTEYAERFVLYPDSRLCGRFDAILKNRDGDRVMTDLKTGLNAVRYPHPTSVQLAFYRNAPWMATKVEETGNKTQVLEWGPMPECDPDVGYVIQLEPDADVGTLYALNIEHGWAGAQLALAVRDWRAGYSYGDDLATLVAEPPAGDKPTWVDLILAAGTLTELRLLYTTCRRGGALTPALKGMFVQRSQALPAES